MPVTDNTDYTPVYNSTPRRYRITWLNDNGNILTETECDYGTMPYYPNGNPFKENDDQFIYLFTGWSPGVTEVTGDATYTANVYRSETRTYLITWHNYDGTILSSEFLPYGATPEYTGTNPDKSSDGMNHYVFSGWDEMIQPVSGDKHYTAQFDTVPHDYLVPDCTNWNYDEHWVEVTYHCTVCGSEERHISNT